MKVMVVSHSAVVDLYRDKFHQLARLGCELHLVLPAGWPEGGRWIAAPRPGVESGIRLHVLPVIFPGKVGGFFLRGLGALTRRLGPDVVHAEEEPYAMACWQAQQAARRVKAAFVFFTWENILRPYKPPLRWIDALVLRRAARAIAGNHDAREVLRARGYRGECAVIPQYGIDPEKFKPATARRAGKIFRIGYFGRLLEEKGIQVLLAAAAQLPFAFQLEIVGNGRYFAPLQKQVRKLGLENKVKFVSALPNAQVPAALQGLDVLVLPSLTRPDWKEQFGRVLAEAMACGVPVIGSDSGEIPHVIGQAGLIFPEGRAQELAARLTTLQHDQKLALALGQQGRERVLAQYTTERIARQTLDVYQHALEVQTP